MLQIILCIGVAVLSMLFMRWAYDACAFRYASRWKNVAIGTAIGFAPVLVLFVAITFLPDDIVQGTIMPGLELKLGNSILHAVVVSSAIFGFNRAYEGLRQETPARRISIGCAMMVFSVAVFFAILASLGRGWLFENTLLLWVGVCISAFAFILSLALILAGIVQAIKRWRYYRRQAREVTIAGL